MSVMFTKFWVLLGPLGKQQDSFPHAANRGIYVGLWKRWFLSFYFKNKGL